MAENTQTAGRWAALTRQELHPSGEVFPMEHVVAIASSPEASLDQHVTARQYQTLCQAFMDLRELVLILWSDRNGVSR